MELKKGRVILKNMTDKQLETYIETADDEKQKECYREMLKGSKSHPKERVWYTMWNIILRDSKKSVGELYFHGSPNDKGEVEVDIEIDESQQAKGYGAEAMNLICKWAFSNENINYVQAKTERNNTACQKMLERAGFRLVSELDGQQVWERERTRSYQSVYICIGIAAGFLMGEILFHNWMLGTAVGALLGIALKQCGF